MKTDVLIIGSGLAGIICALQLAEKPIKILLATASRYYKESNSYLAQGGIATIGLQDNADCFFADIMEAGCYQSDPTAVRQLVYFGPLYIQDLLIKKYGVLFDRCDQKYAYTKEGNHQKNRILHIKDHTGASVMDRLYKHLTAKSNVQVLFQYRATDLAIADHECQGASFYDEKTKSHVLIYAKKTVLATGGCGQLYKQTTNDRTIKGEGFALAHRADAHIRDLAFMQFHPTMLYSPNSNCLLTEALRGEGAKLLNVHHEPFMHLYHEKKELAPRDVVSRAIFDQMQKTNADHVFLDIRFKEKSWLKERFPMLFSACKKQGYDLSKNLVPVVPSAHFQCGGVTVDLDGRTSVKNLFAIGEVASTGVHGANRLASTSLLECLVWAKKAADCIVEEDLSQKIFSYSKSFSCIDEDRSNHRKIYKQLKTIMWKRVGIIRSKESLKTANEEIQKLLSLTSDSLELKNVVITAQLIINSSINSKSIGCHFIQ